jgi:hypothetical protein
VRLGRVARLAARFRDFGWDLARVRARAVARFLAFGRLFARERVARAARRARVWERLAGRLFFAISILLAAWLTAVCKYRIIKCLSHLLRGKSSARRRFDSAQHARA